MAARQRSAGEPGYSRDHVAKHPHPSRRYAGRDSRGDSLGEWFHVNGEGIYATRPWYMYGEGRTEMPHKTIESPSKFKDIRYTTKGDYLYAFVLDWPGKRTVEMQFLAPGNQRIGEIKSLDLLGHDGPIQWEHHPDGLRVVFPQKKPCDFAYCLKIHLARK